MKWCWAVVGGVRETKAVVGCVGSAVGGGVGCAVYCGVSGVDCTLRSEMR